MHQQADSPEATRFTLVLIRVKAHSSGITFGGSNYYQTCFALFLKRGPLSAQLESNSFISKKSFIISSSNSGSIEGEYTQGSKHEISKAVTPMQKKCKNLLCEAISFSRAKYLYDTSCPCARRIISIGSCLHLSAEIFRNNLYIIWRPLLHVS